MKFYLLLFALISFVVSYSLNKDEARGCRIREKEGKCCWENNNGCCAPHSPDTICTQAITICCKTKTYDEETKTYKYTYSYSNSLDE